MKSMMLQSGSFQARGTWMGPSKEPCELAWKRIPSPHTTTRSGVPPDDSAQIAVLLKLLDHLLEVTLAWGGIDGSRLEPLVAQERGHTHQVGPRIERMLAEAVAEGMRGDILKPRKAGVLGDQQLDGSGADALPALADEELIGRGGRAHLQVGGDRLPGVDVQ